MCATWLRRAQGGGVTVLVALAALPGCRCNSTADRPAAPAVSPTVSASPAAPPTPAGSTIPADGLRPPAGHPFAAAATATTVDTLPPPRALADAAPWFAAAQADLRLRLGAALATGDRTWRRSRGAAVWIDTVRLGPRQVAIWLQASDLLIARTAAGCAVRSDAAPTASAACDEEALAATDVLAALTALAAPELAEAWTLEALHTADEGGVRVRASLQSLRLRVSVELDGRGAVRSVATSAATARLNRTGQEWKLDVTGPGASWTWQATSAAAAAPSFLQVAATDGETLQSLADRVGTLLADRKWSTVGPPLLLLERRSDTVAWRALLVPVLRGIEATGLPADVTFVHGTPPGPVTNVVAAPVAALEASLRDLDAGCHALQILGQAATAPDAVVALVRACPR